MGARTWPNLTSALLKGEELATGDTAWAMGEIMAGNATPVQIAGFAVALRAKGETPAELAGLVESMIANATLIKLPEQTRTSAVDVVGTGGDRANTVNISTMAAIVTASAGVTVVKHGNRSASSTTGTADLLEHFGLPLDLGPAGVARTVAEANIGFCFAARYHPGMRHASVTRRELGVPTFFNVLGPLTNPARPTAAAVGCFDPRMAPVMAEVFARRGDSALVMRGEDGLDEFTTAAPTRVWIARDGKVEELLVDSVDLGLPRSQPADLRGGEVAFNADVARRTFAGEQGPVRDAVLLNAAAAFAARSGFPGDFHETLRAGIKRAAEAIDSGATTAQLDRWVTAAQAAKAAE
ncbi:anthranilate phosphoribosyltransferase [Actinoplanes derwentensis]|uniref:Anthranilate phosphoribosyltransferase n=1 Tax=Actinoplanes derwentensis TaxID=113562 RepID=A0A1H2C237_9ACTN|nr:anthranilate phosphoribosyltransferase [Actinoplanes derwentensis]GID84720.1 anthranilate phosphoribosyltransferase [Actinoplanes derwentensis]SDT64598.1 anthranilate phosphoribosyltransferase [Actinoplanes derwentensis]